MSAILTHGLVLSFWIRWRSTKLLFPASNLLWQNSGYFFFDLISDTIVLILITTHFVHSLSEGSYSCSRNSRICVQNRLSWRTQKTSASNWAEITSFKFWIKCLCLDSVMQIFLVLDRKLKKTNVCKHSLSTLWRFHLL